MNLIIHYSKYQINTFIEKLIQLHQLYAQNSYHLDEELETFLKACQTFYKTTGAVNDELVFNELRSYLITARKGFDPKTLEKLKTHKRANLQTASFYCLNQAGEHLKKAIAAIDQLLDETTETLYNILLNLVQSEAMSLEQLYKTDTLEKCELLWSQLIHEKQINIIALKFKQKLHLQDIYILLDNIISKIKIK